MIRVLFVCLGNICRSPLAEAIFTNKVTAAKLQSQFKSDSAGTSDFHIGELPDDRTIKCAAKYSLAMNHRARQVNRGEEGFEEIYQILDEALDSFLAQVKETHQLFV